MNVTALSSLSQRKPDDVKSADDRPSPILAPKTPRSSFYTWIPDLDLPRGAPLPPTGLMHQLHVSKLEDFLKEVAGEPTSLTAKVDRARLSDGDRVRLYAL
ncbi:unnamed protein product [Durusdinium trenchii]|uniref:Uncharacterized protein n=1 Tax=Durusdinium trenchii TaxID=1381693 RepID=A0ABP0MAZ8_9DINO